MPRRYSVVPRSDPAHVARVRAMPCCVPGCLGEPVGAHAVLGTGLSHDRSVVPLCAAHLRLLLRSRLDFELRSGLDLLALAAQINSASVQK